jgi:hypothetical protein
VHDETVLTFESVIRDYFETLDATRDFLATVGPVVLKNHEQASSAAMEVLGPFHTAALMTREDIDTLPIPDEVKEIILKMQSLVRGAEADMAPDKFKEFAADLKKRVPLAIVGGKLELDLDLPVARQILQQERAVEIAAKQVRLLRESALMALVSRTEWFVAQLISLYLRKHPEASGATEPFFSLEMLASLGNVSDAREMLIEHRVEALMRQSFEEWLKFFREKPKLGMSYMDDLKESIVEIFKRRNLIVHNGGRISQRYISEVSDRVRKDLKLGDTIEITTDYLESATNVLEQGLLLLSAELWKKLDASNEARATLLLEVSVARLAQRRWDVARGLSRFVMNDKNEPEATQLRAKINYWQSFKWPGEYDKIRNEVESSDFTAKGSLFQLAHDAIIDDFKGVFTKLPKLLESGELDRNSLETWPLFQAIRQRPEFNMYREPDRGDGPQVPGSEQPGTRNTAAETQDGKKPPAIKPKKTKRKNDPNVLIH